MQQPLGRREVVGEALRIVALHRRLGRAAMVRDA